MSQTFFSKLDVSEKNNRLAQLGVSKVKLTIWIKGKQERHEFLALKFDKDRNQIILDAQDDVFIDGAEVLCTFNLRGMTFFAKVMFIKSAEKFKAVCFEGDLFKSERRSSYRLLTFPLYEVWADFDLGEKYEGGNVVDMNSRVSQTKLFQNFIRLVDGKDVESDDITWIKIRVQDLSTKGMSIHVGELESKHFPKDKIFQDVQIHFTDETIEIPEVKVVYVVDYISNDKNMKKYKIGCNFPDLEPKLDDILGKKINTLLRENDFNNDFENFIK